MKIDGKAIADQILTDLSIKVKSLNYKPTLAVILVGNNPASLAYIKQKQKAAETIGANLIVNQQPTTITKQQLIDLIKKYNKDRSVHGTIIQQPLPPHLDPVTMYRYMITEKDVDGFLPKSKYDVPVAIAVHTILRSTNTNLTNKTIVVIGRGETAGKPIANFFMKQNYQVTVVHSRTKSPEAMIKSGDIIISCVGKERIITKEIISAGVIVISVGIWRDKDGKLRGDYNEDEINNIAAFYTPTPGGVGPVNVACLMQNLVKACMINS